MTLFLLFKLTGYLGLHTRESFTCYKLEIKMCFCLKQVITQMHLCWFEWKKRKLQFSGGYLILHKRRQSVAK